tara:strand:- start:3 stop:254 length:252 start_codon:yes stop_codon:yes gene_type:complete
MKMNPKTEALAFRIWQHCEPLGWDITLADCAKQMGERLGSVRRVVVVKDWGNRFRAKASSWRYHVSPSTPSKIRAEELKGLIG